MHDGKNSRWQLRMRRLALNTQDVPRRAELGYFAVQPAWRTFFSRLCAERVGSACSIYGGIRPRRAHQSGRRSFGRRPAECVCDRGYGGE